MRQYIRKQTSVLVDMYEILMFEKKQYIYFFYIFQWKQIIRKEVCKLIISFALHVQFDFIIFRGCTFY